MRARAGMRRALAAAFVVGVLAACGSGAPEQPASDDSGSASTAGPTAAGSTSNATTAQAEPSSVVPTSAPATSAPALSTPGTFTVVAGGDVLLHPPTWEQADADAGTVGDGALDFTPTMAAIQPVVAAADLALCHLETPLAAPDGPFVGYPAFSVPPQIVPALAATGFDACSSASNHTVDQGLAGVERTAAQMAAGGVPTYGTGVGGRPVNPTVLAVGDVRVGLLSYTYGNNLAAPQPGIVELLDVDDIAADARQARAAGADIVIASVHWGTEYDHDPNAEQRSLAPVLAADTDIDLVIGHHAHVVQPIEQVDGTWVAFGLGNMLAAQGTDVPANREGVLAQFTFTRDGGGWRVTEAAYLPIFVDRDPLLRVVALGRPADTSARHAEALARTREVVRNGAASAALTELAAP